MFDLRLDPALTHTADAIFVARDAVVVGDVRLGVDASVWFHAVIRGDVEEIRVGARTNVQDGSILHADAGFPCIIGDDVTIGHRAIVHGARVGDRALIGMGATVMNGAFVGEECIIGANALIREGQMIPPRSLVLGVPGKIVRELTEPELAMLRMSAMHYVESGKAFQLAGYGR